MSFAVVTGGARGIGRAIAEKLADAGHRLILVDLREDVEAVAHQLDAVAVSTDLATEAGRAAVVAAVGDKPLSVLVNNAGITRDARIEKMDEDAFRAVIRVNLCVPGLLASALSSRIRDGGAIVNISSRAHLGNFGQFNYAVSKGGVIGLTRALARELAPRVRVNAVAPGFVATEMTETIPASVRERIIRSIPLARAADPGEIASAVAWLASEDASYVTGQVLYACGGRSYSS
jgi:NAD(P)-dependent dehydrogenase (short-subunit alcohol dehydrogenase family)